MKLHQLVKSKWLHKKSNRVGRWNATGTGNYSGRWLNGQKSRSGYSMKAFFEWGQTSIVQRLPKARWFTRHYALVDTYEVVNLGKLNLDKRILDAMEISKLVLKEFGYIKNEKGLVKILGDGEYTKKLVFVDIDSFSASAKAKIDNPWTPSTTVGKPYAQIDKTQKVNKPTKQAKVWTLKAVAKKKLPVSIPPKVEDKKTKDIPTPAVTKKPVTKDVAKTVSPSVKQVSKKSSTATTSVTKKVVAKPVVKKTTKAKPAPKKASPKKVK